MRSRRLWIALGALVAIAAVLWIPWATKQRTVVDSTPVPPALFSVTPAPLGPGQTACMQQVTLDSLSQVAEIGVATGGKPGPPLEVTASGPGGYRATTRIPPGYTDTPGLRFPLTPPKRALFGQICIRNAGRQAMSLNGTNEFRTTGRPTLVIDNVPQPFDAQLKLYGRKPASYLDRIGAIFDHAATFTPGFLPEPVLVLLALLALIGIPAGAFAALAIAARSDDDA
jgi:hypothetical protein